MRISIASAIVLAAIVAVGGCSKGPSLPTVPVSGTVTVKGSPLEGAKVVFISKSPDGKTANGLTDAQGNFKVQTYLGGAGRADGALPGDYTVTVGKYAESEAPIMDAAERQKAVEEAMKKGDPNAMPGASKLTTPAKYASAASSPFNNVTIKPSGNEPLKFDLQDE